MTNNEILQKYIDNRLILTCAECQTVRTDRTYFKDLLQDLYLIILEYDNAKLNKIDSDNRMNAWLTRVIKNNIFSTTSPYYKKYLKYDALSQEITEREKQIADE